MRAAILLAAGRGSRFGWSPKPLARRDGRMLIATAIRIARAAPAARLIVVVGRQGDRVAAAARRVDSRVRVVRSRRWRAGRAESLTAAIAALWPIEREVFVFLADMPEVPPLLAGQLARRFGAPARTCHRGGPGHPVLLDAEALAQVRGSGRFARSRLRALAAHRGCRFDVDRRRDLHRLVPKLSG